MHKLLLAAAFTLLPVSAQAQDWYLAGANRDQSAVVMIDKDSIRTKGQRYPSAQILFVMRSDLDGAAALGILMEVDCSGHRRQGLEGRAYDLSGALLRSVGAENDWSPIQPGSLFEPVEAHLCRGTPILGTRSFGSALPIASMRYSLIVTPRPSEGVTP